MPHTNNALKILTGHKSKIDMTLAKPFEDIRLIEKPIVINGISKKIITNVMSDEIVPYITMKLISK